MRTRAYRPEVVSDLENRSLLSSVVGLSADPVILTLWRYKRVTERTSAAFSTFARDREGPDLRNDIYNVVVAIPFGRVDGLGVKINGIVTRMQQDISHHVPQAIRLAHDDVLAAIRNQVKARVLSGDVILRGTP